MKPSLRGLIVALEKQPTRSVTSRGRKAPGFGRHAALAACAALTLFPAVRGQVVTILDTVTSQGYTFTNFDGPSAGNAAAAGTNMNGISNTGTAVGFSITNGGNLVNFTTNPRVSTSATLLNINGSTTAMALGINSTGTVVGTDGSGNAFTLTGSTVGTFIPPGGSSAVAFGINDGGTIVGQYVTATATPGFIRSGSSYITINGPSGPNVVNAQGINNSGQIVGFYIGNDGQDHGFTASQGSAVGGNLTGTPVADPAIPSVAGEPGATFVFSQLLGINDAGTAVGYYGDSTISQHGYIYNTHTGQYTFLDDPDMRFNNGAEITQITGISNAGEITGFYSDANGVFHGFTATPVPEPGSLALLGFGLSASLMAVRRRKQRLFAAARIAKA